VEFSVIIDKAYKHNQKGIKTVLATIVGLDGSSYRKPGTRMLMTEDGQMTFALSGGCIEMYIFKEAKEVFQTGRSKLIEYDGRERLGCEGVLCILLEPIRIDKRVHEFIKKQESDRASYDLISHFVKKDGAMGDFGTEIISAEQQGQCFPLRGVSNDIPFQDSLFEEYRQTIHPPFKLYLFGSGHDVQSFSELASHLGWTTTVVLCEESPRYPDDFPNATHVIRATGNELKNLKPDLQSAAVVMTHNFEKDLDYIQGLLGFNIAYLGMIGSMKRKTKLENYLTSAGFTEAEIKHINTPAGLDIGSETPEEIALSILAEILAITRHRKGNSLKNINRTHIRTAIPH
jgi:xanthine/CO dehydrogenase XdhC/CoxF family maturation factor